MLVDVCSSQRVLLDVVLGKSCCSNCSQGRDEKLTRKGSKSGVCRNMEDHSGEGGGKGEAHTGLSGFDMDGLYDEAHESTSQCHGREIVRPRGTEHCLCNNCMTLGSIVTPSGVGGVASSQYLVSELVKSTTVDMIHTISGLTGRGGISLKLLFEFLEW